MIAHMEGVLGSALIAAGAALVMASQQASPPQQPAWVYPFYTVETHVPVYAPSKSKTVFGVVVPPGASPPNLPDPKRWIVEQRRSEWNFGRPVDQRRWIDSRECPAVAAALEQLQELSSASLAKAGQIPSSLPPFHPHIVKVTGPLGDQHVLGRLTIENNSSGPVLKWWDKAAKQLDNCWKPTAPNVGGPNRSLVTDFEPLRR